MSRAACGFVFSVLAIAAFTTTEAIGQSTTLQRVQARGALHCGIITEEAEYSTSDDHGNREEFDLDLCRAVAAATLGDATKIAPVEYPDDAAAMVGLAKGDVDLVATLTDDFTHTAGTHIAFTRPVLWDGVGFLLPHGSTVTNSRQLSGKKICFLAETAIEESTRAWFAAKHLNFVPFPYQEEGEMEAAFATGNCGALAGDMTHLAQTRTLFTQHGHQTRLLPERISTDPLAMASRDDDAAWSKLCDWVFEFLVAAEEYGVTRANSTAMQKEFAQPDSVNAGLRFLFGGSQEIGNALELKNDWVVRVIAATGNYGEIYERDLGEQSPLHLPRGENSLQRNGGLMKALPLK